MAQPGIGTHLARLDQLDEISRDLLAPGDFHDRLAPAVTAYARLLFELAGIDASDEQQRTHVPTAGGQAIGTFWAAACVKEVRRTQRFCRGLLKAVTRKLAENPNRPVHVIYAGTGPFAALALPVMRRFPAGKLQFTLLEVNPKSFEKLQLVIRALKLEGHVRRAERCDATAWRVPEEAVDIVVSETMNQALKKEPQAGIMLNFARQLADSVIFIPESIRVRLAWQSRTGSPTEDLVELLNFDRGERARILERTPPGGEWAFTPVAWDYRPRSKGTLVYTTFVRVFEDETLNQNDSSLNLPERVSRRLPTRKTQLLFQYRSSGAPGFQMRAADIRDMEPRG